MDSNDQQQPPQAPAPAEGAGGDWRNKLPPNSRRIIISKIVDTLKSCTPISDQESNEYFLNIATKFEGKVFAAACNQNDYLRRISTKLYAAKSKSSISMQNAVPSNSAAMSRYPQTPAIQNMQPQVQSQGQLHPVKMETNQPAAQGRQQLPVQDAQYNITSAGLASASLSSNLPPGNSLPQHPVSNVIPNPNMQNISGVSQDLSSQMHIQGGQNICWAAPQHQIHQSQNPQKYIKQQHQSQPELLNQEVYEGGAQQTLLQPSVQLQQKMLNPFQLQSAQQHYQERSPLQSHVGNPHSGVPSTEANKNVVQTMQQPEISVQQPSSSASTLLSGCGLQQSRQQGMIPRISSQMVQLQQQFGQSQGTSATGDSTFSGSATQPGDSGDWKEEVYQKVKVLKETYLADLVKIYKNVSSKLQQHESLPQQYPADKLEGPRRFKKLMEYLLHFLQVTKSDIQQHHKDRIGSLEKKIMDILGYQMLRKAGHELPRRQLPPPHGQSLQQTHEYRTNPNPHPVSLQGSSTRTMQPVTASNLHGSAASSSSIIPPQQRTMSTFQSSPNLNLRRESARISVDKVSVGSAQHNPTASEQASSRQGVIDLVHSNISSVQSKPNALQSRHPKQPNEHESTQQAQQCKQAYQHNHTQKSWQPHQKEQQVHVQRMKREQPGQIPQTVSNKDNLCPSAQIDQENQPPLSKVGTPLQLSSANFTSKTSLAMESPQEPASSLSAQLPQPDGNGHSSDTISGRSDVLQQPFERLLRVMNSLSSEALNASVSDINAVVCMTDQLAGPQPGNGSTAAVADNLSVMTRCRLQDKNCDAPDKSIGIKRTWDCTNSVPLDVISTGGSPKYSRMQLAGSEASDLVSSATFGVMRRRIETNPALLEEISNVNQHLIGTVVDVVGPNISAAGAEGNEGTVVKCSFSGVSLCPSLKSQFASGHMSSIQPLRLLIPASYPDCSPIMLDKYPLALSLSKEYDDLCLKAQSRFNISLRALSEPMSLMEVARSWDHCVRSFITDYTQLHGGGTFTTKFGAFEDCLSVA